MFHMRYPGLPLRFCEGSQASKLILPMALRSWVFIRRTFLFFLQKKIMGLRIVLFLEHQLILPSPLECLS